MEALIKATPHHSRTQIAPPKISSNRKKYAGHPDGLPRIFGHFDEHLCKLYVCVELCGIALSVWGKERICAESGEICGISWLTSCSPA